MGRLFSAAKIALAGLATLGTAHEMIGERRSTKRIDTNGECISDWNNATSAVQLA